MATVMVKTKHGAVIYVVMIMMAATVPMTNVQAVAVAVIAQMVTLRIVLMRTVVQIHG